MALVGVGWGKEAEAPEVELESLPTVALAVMAGSVCTVLRSCGFRVRDYLRCKR